MFQVRFHGRGGQGVVTAAELLAEAAFGEGRHAQAFPSFGSERVGAPVMSFCRIDDKPIRTHEPVSELDALIIQDATLLHQADLFAGLGRDGYMLINSAKSFDELGLDEFVKDFRPQTHIVEALSAMVKKGELNAEFLNVESEFTALSVAIGASATGARAYTATASQGLLYMSEAVYNAAGLGLPIGTVDIGMACLSGMFERNDDVLYICYDNQAYMNTGVQRSGATPPAARTATTQPVGPEPGNRFGQGKNVPLIAMAHEIGYVATATVADLRDLEYKAARAMDFHGARYLHILVPCPLGWGSSPADTIKVARLATESGLFPVFEAETGQLVSSTPIRHRVPVTDYLRLQARYAHLFRPAERTETVARIQAAADRNIARFGLMADTIYPERTGV